MQFDATYFECRDYLEGYPKNGSKGDDWTIVEILRGFLDLV